jgi:competence protein ComEA
LLSVELVGSRLVKPSGFGRLPVIVIVTLLAVGGYVFFARSRAADSGFTPFQSAPPRQVVSPGPPRPSGLAMGRQMAVIDLNSASLVELETLPAITPDYARRIVAGRPYQSMADVERTGIPRQVLEQMSPPAIIRVAGRGTPPGSLPQPKKTP